MKTQLGTLGIGILLCSFWCAADTRAAQTVEERAAIVADDVILEAADGQRIRVRRDRDYSHVMGIRPRRDVRKAGATTRENLPDPGKTIVVEEIDEVAPHATDRRFNLDEAVDDAIATPDEQPQGRVRGGARETVAPEFRGSPTADTDLSDRPAHMRAKDDRAAGSLPITDGDFQTAQPGREGRLDLGGEVPRKRPDEPISETLEKDVGGQPSLPTDSTDATNSDRPTDVPLGEGAEANRQISVNDGSFQSAVPGRQGPEAAQTGVGDRKAENPAGDGRASKLKKPVRRVVPKAPAITID